MDVKKIKYIVAHSVNEYVSSELRFEHGRVEYLSTDVPIVLGGEVTFGNAKVAIVHGVLSICKNKTNDTSSYIFQTKEVLESGGFHKYERLTQSEVETILKKSYDVDLVKHFMALANYIYELKGKDQFNYRGDWEGVNNE